MRNQLYIYFFSESWDSLHGCRSWVFKKNSKYWKPLDKISKVVNTQLWREFEERWARKSHTQSWALIWVRAIKGLFNPSLLVWLIWPRSKRRWKVCFGGSKSNSVNLDHQTHFLPCFTCLSFCCCNYIGIFLSCGLIQSPFESVRVFWLSSMDVGSDARWGGVSS